MFDDINNYVKEKITFVYEGIELSRFEIESNHLDVYEKLISFINSKENVKVYMWLTNDAIQLLSLILKNKSMCMINTNNILKINVTSQVSDNKILKFLSQCLESWPKTFKP